MDERLGAMGPLPLLEGVVFSQELSDRVLLETGVRASYRKRQQWGTGRFLTPAGPIDNLEEVLNRIILTALRSAAEEEEEEEDEDK